MDDFEHVLRLAARIFKVEIIYPATGWIIRVLGFDSW
jgi:hypothetical protein